MKLYDPNSSVIPVPTIIPLTKSLTVTIDPGSAVPANVGVIVLRVVPGNGLSMIGAIGNIVSTVTVTTSGGDTLRSRSVEVIERVCSHSVSAMGSISVNSPSTSTTVSAMSIPLPFLILMVVPGSPVPLSVGVAVLR